MSKLETKKFMWAKNRNYTPIDHAKELSSFTTSDIKNALTFQKTHPSYKSTPLKYLPNLAKHLGVNDILVKDESTRFELNAFKVMGGIYAIGKYLADKMECNITELSFEELKSTEARQKIGNITFISATDGNHGRGVAWAARELGQKAVIYMPKGTDPERLEAIRNEGAFVEITNANYDETVRKCAILAEKNNWVMIQDTAWQGYEKIPLWIMQGYATIAHEIIEKINDDQKDKPTHIFLQAGVGSFAASIAAYFKTYYEEEAPKVIIVESDRADCYYQSLINKNQEIKVVTGDMNTIMAGLACGEPNYLAFQILSQHAWASFSCSDQIAALGMRVLGNPIGYDERIISGESGAVPLGLLYYLQAYRSREICDSLQLDEKSRVLVINTEGDTSQNGYRNVVWKGMYPI